MYLLYNSYINIWSGVNFLIQLEFMRKDENIRNKIVKQYCDSLANRSRKIAELDN